MISYVRYAFEAFLISMYGFNRCEDVPLILDNSGISENFAYNPYSSLSPSTSLQNNSSNELLNENRRNVAYKNLRTNRSR